jgi:hypothetical protein
MEDDGAVGAAVSSTAYKMVPTVGAVGAAATSPAFKMMMAVGGGGSAQATRKAWFSSARTMRVVGGGPTLRHGIGMAARVGEGAA